MSRLCKSIYKTVRSRITASTTRKDCTGIECIIDQISIVGRQYVAIACFERYCKHFQLTDVAIQAFIDHVWKVAILPNPEAFVAWDKGFWNLEMNPFEKSAVPQRVLNKLPEELDSEFKELLKCTIETSATTWYGSDLEGSKQYLLRVTGILTRHSIEIPPLDPFAQELPLTLNEWGYQITDDKVSKLRALV